MIFEVPLVWPLATGVVELVPGRDVALVGEVVASAQRVDIEFAAGQAQIVFETKSTLWGQRRRCRHSFGTVNTDADEITIKTCVPRFASVLP